ncbi:hypothetical protein ACTFIY_001015 [Dictyostelium cf. discoideum]
MEPIKIKILVLGNSGVGKSSIINVFLKKPIMDESGNIINRSISEKSIVVDNYPIFDFVGEQRYRVLSKPYFINCILLCFSVCDESSFINLDYLVKTIIDRSSPSDSNSGIPFILVGNKIDLSKDQQIITKQMAEEWCKNQFKYNNTHIQYIETSTFKNIGIDDSFISAALISFNALMNLNK